MQHGRMLQIRNMVCNRCIMMLSEVLNSLGYTIMEIRLGSVMIDESPGTVRKADLQKALAGLGFDLVADRKQELHSQVKTIVEEGLRLENEEGKRIKFSGLIAKRLYHDYDTISSVFASVEGITIEKYIIGRRLGIVQDLLRHTRRSLTDIAYSVGYSSVAHLSRQFREHFGIPASEFRALSNVVSG